MVEVEENSCSDPSSSCYVATNWDISDGSLVNTVTVGSTLSPIKDSRISFSKSPLVLRRSASDFSPCDITISFAQKHEVREVYIRSTAQTYKIYYTPNLQGDTKYLHSVGCRVAAEEGSLHAIGGELLTGSKKQLDERFKSFSNISTTGEDWVELKRPDSPPLDRPINMNSGRIQQDFYEAMAEFTGAGSCTSLTLRMQSLQDKGCIYVDEVYVLADPFVSAELDDQQGRVENSAESLLRDVPVPTPLQLSEEDSSQGKDVRKRDKTNEQTVQKIRPERSESANTFNEDDLEIKSNIVHQPDDKVLDHIQSRVPGINSNSESTSPETSVPNNCLERAMDQIVSRVSKIEDILLRFEERMLKPIFSIDARLERVEQQLEILTKNPQCSGTRFCAPDFLATPPMDMSAPVNGSKLVHGHRLAVPKFPNVDDEEQLNGTESVTDKPKESGSTGDALASALAGIACSTSIPAQHYPRTIVVKAPEFLNDEDDNDDVDSTISKNQPGEKVSPSSTPLTSPLSNKPSAPQFSTVMPSFTIGKSTIESGSPSSSSASFAFDSLESLLFQSTETGALAPSSSSLPVTSTSESPCTEVQPSVDRLSLKTDNKAVTEPDPSTMGGFGYKLESSVSSAPGSAPCSTSPRRNLFGGSFGNNTSVNSESSSFTLKNSTEELFRPASFSFQFPQPSQPTQEIVLNPFSGGFSMGTTAQALPRGGGFGQPSQIGPWHGGFGQSRPLGTGLLGVSNFASTSSFGAGFTSTQPTGGGFGNTANGGGFVGASSNGSGFKAFTSHGGGGFSGSGSPTAGGFGMGTTAQAHLTAAGFGQPSQIGPGHGGFGQSGPFGAGFANTATGGGGFAAFSSHDGGGFGAGEFAGTSGSGFPTSGGGFGAFSNPQGSGGFSAFGGKPAPELFTQMRK